jgi:uncharacterized protein DUF4375
VNNGGFAQFLTGQWDVACLAPTALRKIGAERCAAIVDRALAALSDPAHPVKGEVKLSKDTFDALSQLDSEFYRYPDDLTDLYSSSLGAIRTFLAL